jgi:hypothetical protein
VPLVLVFVALLGGVIGYFDFGGRSFSFSWIDGVAVAVCIAGVVQVWRRRRIRLDLSLAAYAWILGTVGLQVVVLDGVWDLVGGASRFLVPALLVLGLSQLLPDDAAATKEPPWQWPWVIGGFGSVLGVWTVVQFVRGLLDPSREELYEVKNAVVVPMGASNYLGAFLLVALVVSATFTLRDRRHLLPCTLTGAGLLATLSRGALLALFAVATVSAIWSRARRTLVALAGLLLAVAAAAAVVTLLPPGGAAGDLTELPALGPPTAGAPLEATGQTRADDPVGARTGLSGVIGGEVRGRLHLFRSAWSAFLDHPLLGVGLNRVADTNAVDGVGHPNVHNLVLHSLAELGLLGTVAYLALYVLLVARIVRIPQPLERRALGTAVAALVLHAQVEAIASTRAAEVLLAVTLVLAATRSGYGVRLLPDTGAGGVHHRAGEGRTAEPGVRSSAGAATASS